MGTDISIYAELRTDEGWQPTPAPAPNRWSKGRVVPTPAFDDIGRPRALISVLSGTSSGFRSQVTTGVPRIAEERGFPSAMSAFYRQAFREKYDRDVHWGASWLALSEIVAFDWYSPCVEQWRFVEPELAPLFERGQPFPQNFPKDATIYHDIFLDPPEGTAKVYWSCSVAEYVGCLDWFLDGLHKLGDADKLRIIFWFG